MVLVDSPQREQLMHALTVASLPVADHPGSPLRIAGTNARDVGNIALVTGIPLSHLSEETTGLEALFLSMVGGAR